MTPTGNFTWADDLASLLTVNPRKAKQWIKTYFTILIEEGAKWGLHINYDKSAIMEMFTQRSNYNYLSDENHYLDQEQRHSCNTHHIPKRQENQNQHPSDTCLQISRNQNYQKLIWSCSHPNLNAKTSYITNAFTATSLASQDLKFCLNTWQLFIRPLLDYSQTYFSFVSPKDRELFTHTIQTIA